MDRRYSNTFTREHTKYVIVCGGGISGLGKGITTSSIGLILKKAGYRVSVIKIDPYLNLDAGTMSPYEHGEVFILEDGGETDLDLGNYERFLDIELTKYNNITSGKIYDSVLKAERQGHYLGKTVQVVPHVTDRVIQWIEDVSKIPVLDNLPPEIMLIEVGGTVGDIESMAYYEALRQMIRMNPQNFCLVFLTFVPNITASGEQKTKIAQQGIKELQHVGLFADLVVCRTTQVLTQESKEKIALFSTLPASRILGAEDVAHLLEVVGRLEDQGLSSIVLEKLKLPIKVPYLDDIKNYVKTSFALKEQPEITIGIVGKYSQFKDAYTSLIKALEFSSIEANINLKIQWIESEDLEDETLEKFETCKNLLLRCQGILVPGGFGYRGTEGKIVAVQMAREKDIPFLGICLGFQMAAIEYARNVMGIKDATSEEFDTTKKGTHVVIFLPESSLTELGGTMRLGSKHTSVQKNDSLLYKIYGQMDVHERHRHRYEINPEYIEKFQKAGLIFSGVDIKKETPRMICLENPNLKFFFGVQYHPEMKNSIQRPNKCFLAFLLASAGKFEQRLKEDGGSLKYQNAWQKK